MVDKPKTQRRCGTYDWVDILGDLAMLTPQSIWSKWGDEGKTLFAKWLDAKALCAYASDELYDVFERIGVSIDYGSADIDDYDRRLVLHGIDNPFFDPSDEILQEVWALGFDKLLAIYAGDGPISRIEWRRPKTPFQSTASPKEG